MRGTSEDVGEFAFEWNEGVCEREVHGIAFVNSTARSYKHLLLKGPDRVHGIWLGGRRHGLRAVVFNA